MYKKEKKSNQYAKVMNIIFGHSFNLIIYLSFNEFLNLGTLSQIPYAVQKSGDELLFEPESVQILQK